MQNIYSLILFYFERLPSHQDSFSQFSSIFPSSNWYARIVVERRAFLYLFAYNRLGRALKGSRYQPFRMQANFLLLPDEERKFPVNRARFDDSSLERSSLCKSYPRSWCLRWYLRCWLWTSLHTRFCSSFCILISSSRLWKNSFLDSTYLHEIF